MIKRGVNHQLSLAASQALLVDLTEGEATVSFDVRGITGTGGVLIIEGTTNTTNWNAIEDTLTGTSQFTADGFVHLSTAGLHAVRLRVGTAANQNVSAVVSFATSHASLPSGNSVSLGELEPANVASVGGTFSGANQQSAVFLAPAGRSFNVAVWPDADTGDLIPPGTSLQGTVYLARALDGSTLTPLTSGGVQLMSFTQVASESWDDSQVGVPYRLVCPTAPSAPIRYLLSA